MIQGAEALQHEQTYERMLLVDWIAQFNECMQRNNYPFDRVFEEHDTDRLGGQTYENFLEMNNHVGVAMVKKNLKRIFNIIDRDRSGRINIDEVRKISSLTLRPDDTDSSLLPSTDQLMETAPEDLEGKAILIRQQVNDIYEEVKEALERKNVTLEHVFFS